MVPKMKTEDLLEEFILLQTEHFRLCDIADRMGNMPLHDSFNLEVDNNYYTLKAVEVELEKRENETRR